MKRISKPLWYGVPELSEDVVRKGMEICRKGHGKLQESDVFDKPNEQSQASA